jgi:hypothetical protein
MTMDMTWSITTIDVIKFKQKSLTRHTHCVMMHLLFPLTTSKRKNPGTYASLSQNGEKKQGPLQSVLDKEAKASINSMRKNVPMISCMPVIPSADLEKSLRFWVEGLRLTMNRK